jgi:hypothetical protein
MILRNTSLSLLALAAALAFSSSPALQAAPLLGPGPKAQTDTMIQQIQAKGDDPEDPDGPAAKKPAKKKAAEKKAKRDAPAKKAAVKSGRCGTYMYWDRKAKRCADARDKK